MPFRNEAERIATLRDRPNPKCPYCPEHDSNVVKRNIAKRARGLPKQVYHCRTCRKFFTGACRDVSLDKPKALTLMCYRCGTMSKYTDRRGTIGGQRGYCHQCRRYFVQGGILELNRCHLLLFKRVQELDLPSDVAAEMYNEAASLVLNGDGYCWTIDLKPLRSKAFGAARGGFSTSQITAYKRAVGDESYDE